MAEADAQDHTSRALLGLPSDWTVLDDVVWPSRRSADIDQVVVGPAGVFVIVSSRTGRSAAAGCRAAADVLAKGARLNRRLVHPVVCSAEPQTGDDDGGVLRCTPDTIVAMLLGRERVLERDELGTARTTVATKVHTRRGLRRSLTGGSSRRDSNAGSTGRLALFLLLVAATIAAVPWAAARVETARAGNPPPTPRLGEAVWVGGTPSRPPLELTAEHVDGARPSYVVQVTVRNDGDRPFAMGALDAALTLDNLQRASGTDTRAELAGAQLEPGRERVVTYRFTVPSGRTAESFVAVVGDRRTEQAHWQVP